MINSINTSRNKIIEKNFKLYEKEVKKIFIKNRKRPEKALEKFEVLFESSFFKRLSSDIESMMKEKTIIKEGVLGAIGDAVNPLDNVGDGAITHAKKVMIMGIIKSIPPLPGGWDFSKLVNNETIIGKSILDFFANLDTNAMLAIPKIATGSVKPSDELCEAYSTAFGEAVCTFLILSSVTGALKAGEAAEAGEEAMDSAVGQGILAGLKTIPNPQVQGIIAFVEKGVQVGAWASKHLGSLIKGLSDSDSPLGAISFESILQTAKKDILGKILNFLESKFNIRGKVCDFIDSFYVEKEEPEINPFTGRPTGVKGKKYNIKSNRYKIDKSKYKIDKSKYGIKESKKLQMRKKDMKKILDEKTIRTIIRKKLLKESAGATDYYAISTSKFDKHLQAISTAKDKVETGYKVIKNSGLGNFALVSNITEEEAKQDGINNSNKIKTAVQVKKDLSNYLNAVLKYLKLITGGDDSWITRNSLKGGTEFTVQHMCHEFLSIVNALKTAIPTSATPVLNTGVESKGYLEKFLGASGVGLPAGIDLGKGPGGANTDGPFCKNTSLGYSLYQGCATTFGTDEDYLNYFAEGKPTKSGTALVDHLSQYYHTFLGIDIKPTGATAGDLNWPAVITGAASSSKGLAALCKEADDDNPDTEIDGELSAASSFPIFKPISGASYQKLTDFLNLIDLAVIRSRDVLRLTKKIPELRSGTGKTIDFTDIQTRETASPGATAVKLANKEENAGKHSDPPPKSEDPEEKKGGEGSGGSGKSGEGKDDGKSEAEKKAEALADERMVLDQEREKLKAEKAKIKEEMELDQLKQQQEYESKESKEARLKERERVIREMRRNPVGVLEFPVEQTRISKKYKRSVEAEGINNGDMFSGIPNVDPSWGSGPTWNSNDVFAKSGDWHRKVQYLIPKLASATDPTDTDKKGRGDVKAPNRLELDSDSSSMVPFGVQDTTSTAVKDIAQKAINTVMNNLKVSRLVLKQPFVMDFKVTGIFDAYTKQGNELQGSDMIFLKGSKFNGVPTSIIPATSYGKPLDVKTIKNALKKSSDPDDKRLLKNFNKIRFFDLSQRGGPIDEKKIKIKIKGEFLGMLKDNIFRKGPGDIAQMMRNIIVNIVEEELITHNMWDRREFFVSSQDLTLRGFDLANYEKGLLFYLDSINVEIRFNPGEYKQGTINETKILSDVILRKIIRSKLIKEATGKEIRVSQVDIDAPYKEDFFDNKGYQDDLNNLVTIENLLPGQEISDGKEKIKDCTIYTIKIKGIKRYEEVTDDTGKRKKAIPDENDVKEFKFATKKKEQGRGLDPYYYDKEKDIYIKIPPEKQKTYFELIKYGTPNKANISSGSKQEIQDAIEDLE